MLIVLIPPTILIVGGAILLMKRSRTVIFSVYVMCFLASLVWVQKLTLPHVVRTDTGRLSPTVGMIAAQINEVVGSSGILAMVLILGMSYYKKSASPFVIGVLQSFGALLFCLMPGMLLASWIIPAVGKIFIAYKSSL